MSNPQWRLVMGGGFNDYCRRMGITIKFTQLPPETSLKDGLVGQYFVPYGDGYSVYVESASGRVVHVGMPPDVNEWLTNPKDHSFLYALTMYRSAVLAIQEARIQELAARVGVPEDQ